MHMLIIFYLVLFRFVVVMPQCHGVSQLSVVFVITLRIGGNHHDLFLSIIVEAIVMYMFVI